MIQYEKRTINLNYIKMILTNLLKNISKIRLIENLKSLFEELETLFVDYSYEKLENLFRDFKSV
jgi:hypothetical protein